MSEDVERGWAFPTSLFATHDIAGAKNAKARRWDIPSIVRDRMLDLNRVVIMVQ
jgi:hypothetical protein